MRCVERTYEYLDGLILVGFLRSNGFDTHLFDENFVRLDWSSVLAYGGFRITVPSHQEAAANELIESYRQGAFAFPEEECDIYECPVCFSQHTQWNSRHRDWIRFALFMIWPWGLLPLIFGYDFTHRFHCPACGHHWHQQSHASFAELQVQTESALHRQVS